MDVVIKEFTYITKTNFQRFLQGIQEETLETINELTSKGISEETHEEILGRTSKEKNKS